MSTLVKLAGKAKRKISQAVLWFGFLVDRYYFKNDSLQFRCNVCGREVIAPISAIEDREMRSCTHCGSNKRHRSIVALLSKELFGTVMAIPDFEDSTQLVGIGLSDSENYASALARVFSYRNTYYHKQPLLDITSIHAELHDTADFVIASEVFEHVPPEIDRAFDNLYQILKPGGLCVFSAPYTNTGKTKEHFPDLFDYQVVKKNGKQILVNRSPQGIDQIYENLTFHGGIGATLEMRVFSRASLTDNLKKAGFENVAINQTSFPEYGVLIKENEASLVISMRKPQQIDSQCPKFSQLVESSMG